MQQDASRLPLRWRPQTFREVIGQPHIVRVLQRAVETHRLSPAYLFSGPRGSGKTSTARILAKALNCVQGPTPEPCLACTPCREIAAGRSPDVLEINGASNRGINEIRNLQDILRFRPLGGKYKVVIIDEVHMLTPEAFNALLKTLEEPPAHVVFILATTEPRKVPLTIVSRCQHMEFHRIAEDEIYRRLVQVAETEQLEADADALRTLARAADGSLRDALSLLEQAHIYADGKITAEHVADVLGLVRPGKLLPLARYLAQGEMAQSLLEFHRLVQEGYDVKTLVDELLVFFRTALWARFQPDHPVAMVQDDETRAVLQEVLNQAREEDLLRVCQLLLECSERLKFSDAPLLQVEITLARICQLPKLVELETVLDWWLQGREWTWDTGDEGDRRAAPRPVPRLLDVAASERSPAPAASPPARPRREGTPDPDSQVAQFLEWLRKQPGWSVFIDHLKGWDLDRAQRRLVLKLPGGFAAMMKDQRPDLETEEVRRWMREHMGAVFQIEVESADAASGRRETDTGAWQEDPDLKKYLEVLGGKIVKVEEEG